MKEGPRKRFARRIGLLLFLIYIAFLVYFLFFADWYGHTPGIREGFPVNYVPFLEIRRYLTAGTTLGKRAVFLNLGGNILGFMPFGFFLPVVTGRMRSLKKTALAALILSAGVELAQLLLSSGSCDIDDVILNTLGAVCGYLLFLVCDGLRKSVQAYYFGK